MNIRRAIRTVSLLSVAVILLAAGAGAAAIRSDTFASGAPSTLSFAMHGDSSPAVPSGTGNPKTPNLGATFFTVTPFTIIVNPTSGSSPGSTTVQGGIDSNAVPEPATLSLVGCALLGLGLFRRKKVTRP